MVQLSFVRTSVSGIYLSQEYNPSTDVRAIKLAAWFATGSYIVNKIPWIRNFSGEIKISGRNSNSFQKHVIADFLLARVNFLCIFLPLSTSNHRSESDQHVNHNCTA